MLNHWLWKYNPIPVIVLLSGLASAQGGSISGQVISPAPPTGSGGPAPLASVLVCPYSGGSGTPCSPTASLFYDPGLTVPAPNPATTDNFGNYSLFAAPTYYLVQVTPVNGIIYSYIVLAGGGTVTSVGLTMPSIFNVANNPVTGSGSLAVTFASETQNLVLASPNGTTGLPVFRSLVANDIPSPLNATNFSGNVGITGNLTASGTLGVTGAATLSSTLGVTGNTTIGGTLGVTGALTSTSAFYCKQVNNVRCVDAANSAGWSGSDAFAWMNSAMSASGSTGTVDARGLNPQNGPYTVTTPLVVPPQTTLQVDSATVFNMNQTGGSSVDAITYGDSSTIDCMSSGVPYNIAYGGFKTTSTTNVRSLLAPAVRSAGSGFFGQSGSIIGCNFISQFSSATIANAMIDIQGCSAFVTLQNVNIWGGYNTIGLQFSPGTIAGNGCSDVYLYNTQVNGENFTGNRPCVFNGASSHTMGGIFLYGLGCQHAGSGKYELEVNGNNGGTGGVFASSISFFGGHVESSTGSLCVKVADVTGFYLTGTEFSGPPCTSIVTISETASGNTANIHLSDIFSTNSATNWVANTAAGGVTVPMNTCGAQPCQILGDYSFKRPNAPQVASAAGCTTAGSIGGQCASATTITWPMAFTDTNYIASCQGTGAITNSPIIGQIVTQSASAITVQTTALTAAAASFANIKCTAVHQ